MHEHDVGRVTHAIERPRHRILAGRAAGDEHNPALDLAHAAPRVVDQFRRQRDDDVVHLRMRIEGPHAARQHRLTGDVEQLLGNRGAKATPGAARGDDGGNTHREKRGL